MIIRLYKFLYRKVITKSLDILWNRRSIKLKKFGSKYGEWNFLDTNDLQLDIEGSEYNVISSILKNNVLPDQILVEFDELYTYGLQQLKKYFKLHDQLIKKDYLAIKTNHFSNQLYIKKKCLKKLH